MRVQRDLSDSLSASESRVWRCFATRFRKTWGVDYPHRVRADQLAFDVLMSRTGNDVKDVCERIVATFDRGERPTSLLEVARNEERRELGRELDLRTAGAA